jgi:chromosome segregation ATPase
MLDNEKKKNSSISLKMKDLSRKYEEIKENLEREKNYSSEVISSFKALHVQFKVLQDEKLLLDKINQDLSVKIHFSQSEHPTPEKTKNDLNLSSLHQDLAKTQQLLKKKNQEIIELKLSKATPRREFSDKDAENTEKELVYFKKYENLLEKFQKLQSEKTQIQNLYVMASSSISEKNQRIQDLTNKLFEFEDRLLTHSKTGESLKHLSINLTAASRGTY